MAALSKRDLTAADVGVPPKAAGITQCKNAREIRSRRGCQIKVWDRLRWKNVTIRRDPGEGTRMRERQRYSRTPMAKG